MYSGIVHTSASKHGETVYCPHPFLFEGFWKLSKMAMYKIHLDVHIAIKYFKALQNFLQDVQMIAKH